MKDPPSLRYGAAGANDTNKEDFEDCLLLSSISGIRVTCGECNYSAAQHRHESDGKHLSGAPTLVFAGKGCKQPEKKIASPSRKQSQHF
jgi:hypothetical protein